MPSRRTIPKLSERKTLLRFELNVVVPHAERLPLLEEMTVL